jgi:hypothetical protein
MKGAQELKAGGWHWLFSLNCNLFSCPNIFQHCMQL